MQSGAGIGLPALRQPLTQWARAWELAGLEERIEIRFSRRFRTSLDRLREPARSASPRR